MNIIKHHPQKTMCVKPSNGVDIELPYNNNEVYIKSRVISNVFNKNGGRNNCITPKRLVL